MYTEHTNIIEKAKEYVNQLMIPLENHYYHQYHHALDVLERAAYLWKKEGLNSEELEMLSLAAIFHDTGFVIRYKDNEEIWAKIARNFLKSLLYPEEKIQVIEKIILATIPWSTPTNIYEEIIKDADLDNLWREDFFQKWSALKKELESINKIKILDPDWQHGYITLLNNHKYYTQTQLEERLKKKEQNKKTVEENLENISQWNDIKVYKYL